MSAADLARLYEDLPAGALRKTGAVPSARPLVDPWAWENLTGRLIEISASRRGAQLTVASEIVVRAQIENELCAWVTPADQSFYPPDFAENGVDLESLVVIRCPDTLRRLRAADHLARSGSFGLVVVDLCADPDAPQNALSRLGGLASHHAMAIVFLTRTPSDLPSLGPLVSLRFEAVCENAAAHPGDDPRRVCAWEVLKDKRHGPGRRREVNVDGPPGMR